MSLAVAQTLRILFVVQHFMLRSDNYLSERNSAMRSWKNHSLLAAISLLAAATLTFGQQIDTSNRNTDRQRDPAIQRQAAGEHAQKGEKKLVELLATKLMLGNHAEIELGKMAAERSEHAGVKNFAQMMVQSHTQLNQELKQFAPQDIAMQLTQLSSNTGERETQSARTNPFDQNAETLSETQTPGNARRRAQTSQSAAQSSGRESHDDTFKQVKKIMLTAGQNHLELTKQMLQEYQGQDFAMGYLGQQIGAHTWMLAELKAIQDIGPQELQQTAEEAARMTQEHLQTAKQLAKQLEDDRFASRQGRSTTNPGSTERVR